MTTRSGGVFITLEGVDGAGKSTQARQIENAFAERGFSVLLTREPTNSLHGREIRRIASEGRGGLEPREEAELFIRDREEHCRDELLPALESGRIVICDRYYHANIAYQGALGLDPAEIRRLNEGRFPKPDLTLYLRVDPQLSLERIRQGREGGTNVGFEKADYLKKVAEIFDSMEDPYIARVDASRGAGEVFRDILTIIEERGLFGK